MNVTDIVATAVSTLIVLVLAHVAVYWVVKTLYPPAPVPVPVEEPVRTVTFAEPPKEEHVERLVLPTYEAPVPTEAPRETGERRGPPPPEDTSIRRKPGVDAPDAQRSG